VPLGPAEVHAQEHLRPVGRLRSAGAGTDREDGRACVVLAREKQLGALPPEVGVQRRRLPLELGEELRIGGLLDQLERRQEVVDTALEAAPQLDLVAKAVSLAKGLLRAGLIVPEAGFAGQRLQLGDAAFLRLEVKDAPRSTGSARPGRG